MKRDAGDVTEKLRAWSRGDPDALQELMPLVFSELRRAAHFYFRREDPAHTLQPTQLIGMVWEQLAGLKKVQWENRAQFFAFAGQLIRRMLIDYALARKTAKRGGNIEMVSLSDAMDRSAQPVLDPDTLLHLNRALERLEKLDPPAAQIVELRFFSGLTSAETAKVLGISRATVTRNWKTIQSWLAKELSEEHSLS